MHKHTHPHYTYEHAFSAEFSHLVLDTVHLGVTGRQPKFESLREGPSEILWSQFSFGIFQNQSFLTNDSFLLGWDSRTVQILFDNAACHLPNKPHEIRIVCGTLDVNVCYRLFSVLLHQGIKGVGGLSEGLGARPRKSRQCPDLLVGGGSSRITKASKATGTRRRTRSLLLLFVLVDLGR